MPSIDQIIHDEITRNAKREIRAAVTEWLQHEASDAVAGQVKTAIQPFLVMMNDQRKVIEALHAQLEVSSHPLARKVAIQPKKTSTQKAILFNPNSEIASRKEIQHPAKNAKRQSSVSSSKSSTTNFKVNKNNPEFAALTPRPDDWGYRNEPRLPKERIIRVREKLGIKQAQMGMLLGVDAFVIHNWENGKTSPSVDQKRQIAFIRDLNLAERRKLFIAKKILRRNGTK